LERPGDSQKEKAFDCAVHEADTVDRDARKGREGGDKEGEVVPDAPLLRVLGGAPDGWRLNPALVDLGNRKRECRTCKL
jgi:hypothetical protein